MSEKRFIVETVEIIDCDTDESRIAKVITDTNELYSYDDLYELCDDLNKLAEENEQLRQELEENKSIINFCSNGDEDGDLHRLIKENEQLRQQLQEMKSDEKLYAQEILELNKTKKEMLNFKQLGGDY